MQIEVVALTWYATHNILGYINIIKLTFELNLHLSKHVTRFMQVFTTTLIGHFSTCLETIMLGHESGKIFFLFVV